MKSDIEMFSKMCEKITIFKGEFICLYEDMQYEDGFSDITQSERFEILKVKMDNLLVKLNENHELINCDLETELWCII